MNDITAIAVNFKTPLEIEDCIVTFLEHYPDTPVILIDNGGCDESLQVCRQLRDSHSEITLLENRANKGHGPSLNQGLALVETDYAFLLDSDTRTEQGGFLEKMLQRFEDNTILFAVGWLRYVDETRGVPHPKQDKKVGLSYIHPHACLLKVAAFRWIQQMLRYNDPECKGFTHSGAPALRVMSMAKLLGLDVEDFPVADYIWHKVAGTRGRFGGRWKIGTKEEPGAWGWRPI